MTYFNISLPFSRTMSCMFTFGRFSFEKLSIIKKRPPPSTDMMANIVRGTSIPYELAVPTNGAHKNQVRAHMADDNINTFRFSGDIRSAAHVVSMAMAAEAVILMTIHGIMVSATI